ncbi:MAG TPA: hypothetical protein VHY08_22650 [Bacillota bacterium]|nr:hypothetical protein [Bacillota bacterium]
MSSLMMILTVISFAGLIVVAIFHYFKTKNIRNLIIHLLLSIIGFAFVYWFFFPHDTLTPKGGEEGNDYLIIAAYIFLILGMLVHYVFFRLWSSRKRKKFDWGYFFAPVLISPIVFIPVLITFQSADINLDTMSAKLLYLFIAFENGFFWREFFDNRCKEKGENQNVKTGIPA